MLLATRWLKSGANRPSLLSWTTTTRPCSDARDARFAPAKAAVSGGSGRDVGCHPKQKRERRPSTRSHPGDCGRAAHRAPALGAHHLPPSTPLAVRLRRRRHRRPRPRRSSATTHLSTTQLNAYPYWIPAPIQTFRSFPVEMCARCAPSSAVFDPRRSRDIGYVPPRWPDPKAEDHRRASQHPLRRGRLDWAR
jgi:hypothetical protein